MPLFILTGGTYIWLKNILGCETPPMASYLSYFTSSGGASTPGQQYNISSSASAWSSAFSSRIATLRKALTKDAEEDDPDNEDCSHVSNVLRAYYTEKGRPFPEWLPPDPKKPAPAPVIQQNMYTQFSSNYGSQYGAQPTHDRAGSGGRGGLSDLWDSSPSTAPPPQQSLRAPKPTPPSLRPQDSGSSYSSGTAGLTPSFSQGSGARPLPSQRAGSFQNIAASNPAAMGSRDRLRARLQGGGSGRSSPAPPSSSGSQFASYSSGGGSYDGPQMSASEPWSNNNPYQYDSGYSQPAAGNPYGNQSSRARPGLPSGPRGPR